MHGPTRQVIGERYDRWAERILASFPEDYRGEDTFGLRVDRNAVRQYLEEGRPRCLTLMRQALKWAGGERVGEVGAHYGMNLLLMGRELGWEVTGYELPGNIPVYCAALEREGIPVEPFDLYAGPSAPPDPPHDLVLCSEVVEHLFVDVTTVIENLRPLVRIGGRLLLTTPNIYRRRNLMRLLRGLNVCERHPGKERRVAGVPVDARIHPREYTLFEIAAAFESAPAWRLLGVWTDLSGRPLRGIREHLRCLLLKVHLRFPMGDYIFAVAERTA